MSHNGGSSWSYSDKTGCILEWITVTPGNNRWYAGGWTYNNWFHSTDNGYNWTSRTMPTVGALNFAGSSSGQYVYAGTGNAAGTRGIQKSTDYGANFSFTSNITTGGNGHILVDCDDSGQYVIAAYNGNGVTSIGFNFSTDYASNFTKLTTVGCMPAIWGDASEIFYLDNTNGRLYMTTNQGGSWSYITIPNSWTWGTLGFSKANKRIYLTRSNSSPYVYRLNSARNGWDLLYTGAYNTYGPIGTSELSDEIFVTLNNGGTSFPMYKINQSGTATLIYTGTSNKYVPNII
jgi:hypothetical protein